MFYRITIALLSLLILSGCTDRKHDIRLVHIAETVSESPEEALSLLDSIDYTLLSAADRHYYDLLSIKAKDKAYIYHTSDSLILNVIEYYSRYKNDPGYPEALYYGGRVYSDLGDSHTALQYFQQALEHADNNNNLLRGKILSQTGRLLNDLRLYKEAIPYIEEAIKCDQSLNDSINEVYDLQLLGAIHLMYEDNDKAKLFFIRAYNKSKNLHPKHIAKSAMYLAATEYQMGNISAALQLIRKTPDLVSSIARNSALSYAMDIYNAAGIQDTAYMYAKELLSNEDFENKQKAYHLLLLPKYLHYSHKDSIPKIAREYAILIEDKFDNNENQLAINQQSLYNYQLHEKKKVLAEKNYRRLWIVTTSAIIIALIFALVIFILKNRHKKTIISLHKTINNFYELERRLNYNRGNSNLTSRFNDNLKYESSDTVLTLRDKLRKKLLTIYQENPDTSISSHILDSESYKKLRDYISDGQVLKEDNPLWKDLENTILQTSPNFLTNLQLLVGGKLSSYDYHTTLLIKCGISPSEMTILLNRTKGTIVSRRESLCYRVFDEKLGTKVIDGIIRLL